MQVDATTRTATTTTIAGASTATKTPAVSLRRVDTSFEAQAAAKPSKPYRPIAGA